MVRHLSTFALLCCALIVCAGAAQAQSNLGTIGGTVRDDQNNALVNANVTVTQVAKNIARNVTTNEAGNYFVPLLEPGEYSVAVEAQGFKRAVRTGIILQVADRLTVDLALSVGDVKETVTVQGDAPLVDATSTTLGQVIERRRIVDLPLNGRDAFSLAGLAPGVVPFQPAPGAAIQLGVAPPSISGAPISTSEVVIDGATDSVPRNNTFLLSYVPSVDTVEEFKVQTNALSAEHGRFNGGIISVVTKSGTNQFHGTLYEFHRNSAFDANNFFANRSRLPLGALKRNQYGVAIGGPLWLPEKIFGPAAYDGRNRLFFFFNYEGFRESLLNVGNFTVPTAAERRGDFSQTFNATGQLIQIFDPLATRPNPGGAGVIRDPFPGNIIPEARISPIARRLLEFFPLPNNNNRVGNLVLSVPRRNVSDISNARVDYQVNSDFKIFGRYAHQNPLVGEPNFFGNIGNPTNPPLQQLRRSFVLQSTYAFSPTTLMNLQYGLTRQWGGRTGWSDGLDITTLGFPANFREGQQINGLPGIGLPGYTGLGPGVPTILSTQTAHMFLGTLSKVVGNHSLKAGFDWRAYFNNQIQNFGIFGNLAFNLNFTQGPNPNQASAAAGNAVATLLLGYPAGSIARQPSTAYGSRYLAGFLQDDWKVTPRLTLNLGLRYDVNLPRTERFDRASVFDPLAASPLAARVPGLPALKGALGYRDADNRRLYETDRNNFGPRFGIAYQLLPRTTIRAGYGLFYGLTIADATISGEFLEGFSANTGIVSTLDGITPISSLANPFPAGINRELVRGQLGPETNLGLGIFSALVTGDTSYFQQWNLTVQQGIGNNLLLEIAYAGNKGNKVLLPTNLDLNALTPEQLALGTANQQLVANPFAGIITNPTSLLAVPMVARGQLLRPFPQYTSVLAPFPSIGNLIYHSMQAKVERRFARGFTILGSYTWSKNINDLSTSVLTPYNLRLERSLDVSDAPHRLAISGIWELPLGRGRALGKDWNRALDIVLGGWQINGIAAFQSGFPLVMSSTSGGRPNRLAKGQALTERPQDRLLRYFDTSAFAVPAPFTLGNSSRTAPDLRAHGVNNFDLSLFKNFRLLENLNAQFRFEAFNAFNRVQFAAPGTTVGNISFGVVTAQQNSPRQLQLALKLIF